MPLPSNDILKSRDIYPAKSGKGLLQNLTFQRRYRCRMKEGFANGKM